MDFRRAHEEVNGAVAVGWRGGRAKGDPYGISLFVCFLERGMYNLYEIASHQQQIAVQ